MYLTDEAHLLVNKN